MTRTVTIARWRDCFPYTDEQLPSISLSGARGKDDVPEEYEIKKIAMF